MCFFSKRGEFRKHGEKIWNKNNGKLYLDVLLEVRING